LRRSFSDLADLEAAREVTIESPWIEITQQLIDAFASTTADRQWIHVDPDRAARESPYGTTVAHGFLTLSLLPRMFHESCEVTAALSINYGFDRVRFVTPVRSGARIRGRFKITELRPIEDGVHVVWHVGVEIEGESRPALAASWLLRLISA